MVEKDRKHNGAEEKSNNNREEGRTEARVLHTRESPSVADLGIISWSSSAMTPLIRLRRNRGRVKSESAEKVERDSGSKACRRNSNFIDDCSAAVEAVFAGLIKIIRNYSGPPITSNLPNRGTGCSLDELGSGATRACILGLFRVASRRD